jgi:hypothetical protein
MFYSRDIHDDPSVKAPNSKRQRIATAIDSANETDKSTTFRDLPLDTFYHIILFLDTRTNYLALSLVSRSFHDILFSNEFLLQQINLYRIRDVHDLHQMHQQTEEELDRGRDKYVDQSKEKTLVDQSISNHINKTVMTESRLNKMIERMNTSLSKAKQGFKLTETEVEQGIQLSPLSPKDVGFPKIDYLYILKRRYLMHRYLLERHYTHCEEDADSSITVQNDDTNTHSLYSIRFGSLNGAFSDVFPDAVENGSLSDHEEICISWSDTYADDAKLLVKHDEEVQHIKSINFADVVQWQYDISWITLCDVTPILNHYSNLMFWKSKGMNELKLHCIRKETLLSITLIVSSYWSYANSADWRFK